MNETGRTKLGSTKKRWDVAMKDKAFDLIRDLALIKTKPSIFLRSSTKAQYRPMCSYVGCKTSPSTWTGYRKPHPQAAMARDTVQGEARNYIG
jgi:hypothetical protein